MRVPGIAEAQLSQLCFWCADTARQAVLMSIPSCKRYETTSAVPIGSSIEQPRRWIYDDYNRIPIPVVPVIKVTGSCSPKEFSAKRRTYGTQCFLYYHAGELSGPKRILGPGGGSWKIACRWFCVTRKKKVRRGPWSKYFALMFTNLCMPYPISWT